MADYKMSAVAVIDPKNAHLPTDTLYQTSLFLSHKDLRAPSRVTGYSGWVRLKIHKEKFRALISSRVPLEEGKASSVPSFPIKASGGWHEPLTLRERTLLTPTVISRSKPTEIPLHPRTSTFAVSDLPLLDMHNVAQIEVTHQFLQYPVFVLLKHKRHPKSTTARNGKVIEFSSKHFCQLKRGHVTLTMADSAKLCYGATLCGLILLQFFRLIVSFLQGIFSLNEADLTISLPQTDVTPILTSPTFYSGLSADISWTFVIEMAARKT
ncbi:hypothetical protein J6590_057306, partial [Homalodisca vitripennis]